MKLKRGSRREVYDVVEWELLNAVKEGVATLKDLRGFREDYNRQVDLNLFWRSEGPSRVDSNQFIGDLNKLLQRNFNGVLNASFLEAPKYVEHDTQILLQLPGERNQGGWSMWESSHSPHVAVKVLIGRVVTEIMDSVHALELMTGAILGRDTCWVAVFRQYGEQQQEIGGCACPLFARALGVDPCDYFSDDGFVDMDIPSGNYFPHLSGDDQRTIALELANSCGLFGADRSSCDRTLLQVGKKPVQPVGAGFVPHIVLI